MNFCDTTLVATQRDTFLRSAGTKSYGRYISYGDASRNSPGNATSCTEP